MLKVADTERPSTGPRVAKEQARALYATGRYSQREVAELVGHAQPVVQRWVKGIARPKPTVEELSVRQASERSGIPKDAILAACVDDRLTSRFGAREFKTGRTGPREQWVILPADLDAFVAALQPCRHPGCTELGHTPDGFCGRPDHVMSTTMKEQPRARRIAWLRAYYDSDRSADERARRSTARREFAATPAGRAMFARVGKISAARARESWQTGTGMARAVIELRSGTARRAWKLRWTKSPGRPTKYHPETTELVRGLRAAGRSWNEIEAETGVPRDTARRMAGAR
jgi:hypothetical protein